MASIGNLEIFLTADVSQLSKTIKTGQQLMRELAQQFVASGKSIENFNANVVAGLKRSEQAMGNAKGPATQLMQVLKDLEKTTLSQNQALVAGTMETKNATMAYLAEQQAINNDKAAKKLYNDVTTQGTAAQKTADTATKEYINTLVNMEKEQIAVQREVKSLSSSMWLMTAGLTQFGSAMSIAFTAPLVAAAGASVKVFSDWEKAQVAIQRAAELSTAQAKVITDSFVTISQQVPLTVADLQKAGYAAAQAGVTGTDAIVNFAKAATMLSTVGGDAMKNLPIEDLANNLAKLSIAFGETGDNWERVNNIASTLLVVAKAVPGGLGEVVEGMKRVSGTAKTMGLNLQDTTALIGTLVAAGIPASRAGTELNSMLMDMANNSDKVAQALGYTSENMGAFKDRMQNDVMGVLNELLQRYSEVGNRVDVINHLQETFGDVSSKALLPLIQNVDILNDLMARANGEFESGALLNAEFATQANSLAGTMTVFSSAIKSVAYAIGTDLAPYVNWLAKTATAAIINFAKIWQAIPGPIKLVTVAIAALVAILGPLALLINTAFISPIAGITTFITKTIQAVAALGALSGQGAVTTIAMNELAVSFGAATAGISTLIKGIAVLATRFLVITAILAAITLAVYALGKAFGISFKMPSMPDIKLPKYKSGSLTAGANQASDEEMDMVTKAEQKAADDRVKAAEKELKTKQRARDKELRSIEDGIRDYEKVRDAQIKAQQKLVDATQEELDLKKEQWEKEQDLEQDKISAQEDILDAAKKTLQAAKKQLNALKEAQDKQVEAAQNSVDYAEMNLKNAQDVLKREKDLGHDEYDASFRAAEESVKYWEDKVKLARLNLTQVQTLTQQEIDAQQDIVDQDQEIVDNQQGIIDELKDALDKRKELYDDEISVIQDELDVRKKALDKVKDTTQEKLDLLREEKQERQDALADEIAVLQDNVDNAREKAQQLKDMPVPELPDIAQNMDKLNEEIQKQIDDLNNQVGSSLDFGLVAEKGGLWDRIKTRFEEAKQEAKDAGYGVVIQYIWGIINGFERLGDGVSRAIETFLEKAFEFGQDIDKMIVNAVFGAGTWEKMNKEAESKGRILSNAFTTALVNAIIAAAPSWVGALLDVLYGAGTFDQLKKQSEESGKSIAQLLVDSFVANISFLGDSIAQALFDAFYGEDTWAELKRMSQESGLTIPQLLWESFKLNIKTVFSSIGTEIQNAIIQPIKNKYEEMRKTGSDLLGGLKKGFDDKYTEVSNKLTDIWNKIKSIFQYVWQYAHGWGQDLMSGFRQGLSDSWAWLKSSFENIWDRIKGSIKNAFGIHSPSKLFNDYGKYMMQGLEEGISKFGSTAVNSLSDVAKQLSEVDLTKGMDISPIIGSPTANISNQAGQVTSMRESQLATVPATTSTTVNRNFYIQPGQMIASRGEIRSFMRMLKEYDKFEEGR